MNWYFTSLLIYCRFQAGSEISLAIRRCHYLLVAPSSDDAHAKSAALGNHAVARMPRHQHQIGVWTFQGIVDLLMVYELPQDGAELVWSELELDQSELAQTIRKREELRAFSEEAQPRASGWYVGSVVIREVHDEGQGEHGLVWINSYLIRAADIESAYQRVLLLGKEQETEIASHSCNGDKAHWEFIGIEDLIGTCEPPSDGALLWYDELENPHPNLVLPARSELSVFKWEAGQRERQRGGYRPTAST